jgi:long-chain acyl-CoA synthetase
MNSAQALSLADVCRELRSSYPACHAVACADVHLTYEELDVRVNRLANAFLARGVSEGDRILWLAQNCHRLLETFLACAKIGAVFAPANWRAAAPELAFLIEDLEPRIVIWQQEQIGEAVGTARSMAGEGALWLQVDPAGDGESESYEAVLGSGGAEDPDRDVDPGLPVMIMFTAAFGGQPNGSMLTHTGLLVQGVWTMYLQDIDSSTVCLNSGPLFHIAAWGAAMLPTFRAGGTNVFIKRADPEEICAVIDRERCNRGWLLPPTATQIAEINRDGRYDLSCFQSPIAVPGWSEMVSPDRSRRGQAPGGYGQIELTGGTIDAALGGRPGDYTCGRPSPHARLRIVDEADEDVAPGDVGEIIVRGPHVHAGYWNRPDLNAARFRNGWWHTNDLARREPDGAVSFIGPKGRLIKSAGENIYPAEVELCLEAHAAVKEAAVIGVPDDKWMQSVKAVVVRHPGAAVSGEELIEHCRQSLASYKKPRVVEFVDLLHRVGIAKDYDTLDQQFGGGGYPGSGTGAFSKT